MKMLTYKVIRDGRVGLMISPGRGLLRNYEPSCGPSFEALVTRDMTRSSAWQFVWTNADTGTTCTWCDLRLTAMLIHILYTGPDIYIIQKRGDPGIVGTQTWALWFYLDSMEGYQLHSVIL